MDNEQFYISDEIIGTKLGTALVNVMSAYESLYHAFYHDDDYRADYCDWVHMLGQNCACLALLFDKHGADGRLFDADAERADHNRALRDQCYKDICMDESIRFADTFEAVIRVSHELYKIWREPDKIPYDSYLYDEIDCLKSWSLELACMALCGKVKLIFEKLAKNADFPSDLAFKREHMGIYWYMKTQSELKEECVRQNEAYRTSTKRSSVGVGAKSD